MIDQEDRKNKNYEVVFARALAVFNSVDKAHEWMLTSCEALADEIPLDLLDSDEGVKLVMEALGQIEQEYSTDW